MTSLLGSGDFIQGVKERFFREKTHKEVPEACLLAPEIETIKEIVCEVYRVNTSELLVSKRGVFNEPRNAAIYLARQLRQSGLNKICTAFQMSRYSSASSAIKRMKNELSKNREMKKRVEKIKMRLVKGQAQTCA